MRSSCGALGAALLGLSLGLLACSQQGQPVRTEQRTTPTGHGYALFHPQHLSPQVVTHRPDAGNRRTQLSVAAAYTDLDNDQPLDLLVCNGHLRQTTATVGFLDGALTITGDTLAIAQIPRGQAPPRAQLERVARRHGSLLLQELLVFQGRNQKPAGGSAFQRRALVESADHRFAVVESLADDVTMQQFGDDLVALGARNALYLDMGGWDEGWYRAGGNVVGLGHRRTDTARQSNWLVFTDAAARQ